MFNTKLFYLQGGVFHIEIMDGKLFFSMKLILWLFLLVCDELNSSYSQGEYGAVSPYMNKDGEFYMRGLNLVTWVFVACNIRGAFHSTKNSRIFQDISIIRL